MTEENSVNNTILVSVGTGIILFMVWIKIKEKVMKGISFLYTLQWIKIIVIIVLIISTVFIIYFLHKHYKNKRTEKEIEKDYLNKKKEYVNSILNVNLESLSSQELKQKLEETKKKLNSYTTEEDKTMIKKFYKKIEELIQQAEQQEELVRKNKLKIEELKIKDEERKKQFVQKQIEELFMFKKEKNSVEALPLNHNYSNSIIEQAEWRMKHFLLEKENKKICREEAISYYKENTLDTQPKITEELKQEIYKQVREEIGKGKISIEEKPRIEYTGKKLKNDFYRAKELNPEMKARAKAQGFTHFKGVELDGSLSGGFYIRKKNSRESDYHFCLKHLFSELPNAEMEYCIDGKRVDVALLLPNYKVGIEIETGANKDKQLVEKKVWLDKHFDHWIIICSRDLLLKYNQLVNHKKSKCMTLTEAKKYLDKLITSAD